MPDWTYRTLLRPVLFQMSANRARGWILSALHALGRLPGGPGLIAFMGHAAPAPSLTRSVLGLTLEAPLAFSADLAGNEIGLAGLRRLGVGLVEVGPVALQGGLRQRLDRRSTSEEIVVDHEGAVGVDTLLEQLAASRSGPGKLVIRLAHQPHQEAVAAAEERMALIRRLAPVADGFSLTPPPPCWNAFEWAAHIAAVQGAAEAHCRPLLAGVSVDDLALAESRLESAYAVGVRGFLICGGMGIMGTPEHRRLGRAALAPTDALIYRLRSRYGQRGVAIVASAGVCEPCEAVALLETGADVIGLDVGLVFSGPGLPKRIQEAVRCRMDEQRQTPAAFGEWFARSRLARALQTESWLWLALLGLGLIAAGLAAWVVAHTSVILPYDESFVGLTLAQINAINPRLPGFMTHDRVSLAATMVSIGILYVMLAWHAVRLGEHWAFQTLVASAMAGFASFWLWLGYGYLDPLHAFVSGCLLVPFLLALRSPVSRPPRVPQPDWRNDTAWSHAVWGQLGIVSVGVGLIVAGLTISYVGLTSVFVREDLVFLCTTSAALATANERLHALLAHDRAGFGGALVSNGLAVLLIGLWGIRRGARWIWWALLASGAVGFVGALGVHALVGYLDPVHLFPGVLALTLWVASLAALRPYLMGETIAQRQAWRRLWVEE